MHPARRISPLVAGLAGALCAAPLSAGPLARVESPPPGAALLDTRAEDTCLASAPPEARCLPAAWFFEGDAPIGFHALRWLLGTVGLAGAEPLVVIGDDAPAVAALIHIAGQASVAIHAGPAPAGLGGSPRSLTREAIYTAPMRLSALRLAASAPGTPRERLAAHARTGAPVILTQPQE